MDVFEKKKLDKAEACIKKAKKSRSKHTCSLKKCIRHLSKAIRLLEDIYQPPNFILHHLCKAHWLRALCLQEAQPYSEQIFGDVKAALDLWSKIYIVDSSEEKDVFLPHNMTLLLDIIDLLHMKGFMELCDGAYQLVIKFFELLNVPTKKWLKLMWKSRRLNHVLCVSPVNKAFTNSGDLKEFDFYAYEDKQPGLNGIVQSLSFLLSGSHDTTINVRASKLLDKVHRKATRLESTSTEITAKTIHSIFFAAYMYLDMSKRLVTNGELQEALACAKRADDLFLLVFEENFDGDNLVLNQKLDEEGYATINSSDNLVAIVKTQVVETALSLMSNKSRGFEKTYISPWKAMQGYLEGILQMAIINEMFGNGEIALLYIKEGRNISYMLDFPMFRVAFSSLLGKMLLQSTDLAEKGEGESELASTENILKDGNRKAFCCPRCKSMLEATLYQHFGDGDMKKVMLEATLCQHFGDADMKKAKRRYRRALKLLDRPIWKNSLTCPKDDDEFDAQQKRNRKTKNGIGCRSIGLSSIRRCWHCLPSEVAKSKSLDDLINLKWEFVRRQLSLDLQSRLVKCFSYTDEIDKARKILLKGISVLVGKNSFHHTFTAIPKDCINLLVAVEIQGDVFAIERAKLIYHICCYSLRYYSSEIARKLFCNLAPIKFEDLASWLKVAFVLSREVPEVFEKVSKLLAVMYVVSSSSEKVSLSSFTKDLGENYWSSYFHQASIGVHSTHKFHSLLTGRFKGQCDTRSSSIKEETFNSLGVVPKGTKDLKEHVKKFLVGHSTTTIISISILGPEFITFLGELHYSPDTSVRAWMLVSRLSRKHEPVVLLLPLDPIPQGEIDLTRYEKPKREFCCPWNGFALVDSIVPSLRAMLEENHFIIESGVDDVSRGDLDDRFAELLRNLEDSWFGPWKCLLLGEWSNSRRLDSLVEAMGTELKNKHDLEVDHDLLKIILGGSKSVYNVEALVSSKKDSYIAKVGHVDEPWSAVVPNAVEKSAFKDAFIKILKRAFAALEKGREVSRKPVILVLDYDVQMLPWESLPIIRCEEISRMPSVSSIFAVLDEGRPPSIDPLSAFYLINPENNLDWHKESEKFMRREKRLKGWARCALSESDEEKLIASMEKHDLFLFFGHGCGSQYIPPPVFKHLEKVHKCPVIVLMGCSSGACQLDEGYAPTWTPLTYLSFGSSAVVANLWDGIDKHAYQFGCIMFDDWCDNEGCRIGALMPRVREEFPFMVGASTVCFGVPTMIRWKIVKSPKPKKQKR